MNKSLCGRERHLRRRSWITGWAGMMLVGKGQVWLVKEVNSRAECILDKRKVSREFPGNPVVRTGYFHWRGLGSIPGQETKILQTMWHGQKEAKFRSNNSVMMVMVMSAAAMATVWGWDWEEGQWIGEDWELWHHSLFLGRKKASLFG